MSEKILPIRRKPLFNQSMEKLSIRFHKFQPCKVKNGSVPTFR